MVLSKPAHIAQEYRYRFFNAVLASEVPLDLPKADRGDVKWLFLKQVPPGCADVVLARCRLGTSEVPVDSEVHVPVQGGCYTFTPDAKSQFWIGQSGGWIACGEGTDPYSAQVHQLLFNQVLPTAAAMSGGRVFHAAAVDFDGVSAIFLGPSGYGKSTLSTALARMGHRFVGDDCVLVERVGGDWHVMPSYASLRLWDDSVDALMSGTAHHPVGYYGNKQVFKPAGQLPTADPSRALKLGKIYILNAPERCFDLSTTVIEPIELAAGFRALLEAQYRLSACTEMGLAAEFRELAQLAAEAPMALLSYQRDFSRLDLVCQTIAQDMA
jgi:hypothetical protein